jgi:hypothetical protein
MNTLLALLALVGQPAVVASDLGACSGVVVAPGQVVLTDGTCSFAGAAVFVEDGTRQDGDPAGYVTHARTLPSGRVVVTFGGVL